MGTVWLQFPVTYKIFRLKLEFELIRVHLTEKKLCSKNKKSVSIKNSLLKSSIWTIYHMVIPYDSYVSNTERQLPGTNDCGPQSVAHKLSSQNLEWQRYPQKVSNLLFAFYPYNLSELCHKYIKPTSSRVHPVLTCLNRNLIFVPDMRMDHSLMFVLIDVTHSNELL